MPDTSKLFSKRLSEDSYKQLQSYLDGKVKFSDIKSDAQNVLNAITKPEHDRSFNEQEKLYEMKLKLIADKYMSDTDAWDQFEVVYRAFMLGTAAREKYYKLKGSLLAPERALAPGGLTTKSGMYDPFHNYNVEKWDKLAMEHFWDEKKSLRGFVDEKWGVKWNKRAMENFWDDKEELPGFENEYRGMSLEGQKIQYKKDFFDWLDDPENTRGMAAEYRGDVAQYKKDFFEYMEDPQTTIAMAKEYRTDFRIKDSIPKSKISKIKRFDPKKEPLLEAPPPEANRLLNKFLSEDIQGFTMGVKGLRVNVEKFKKFLKEQGEIGIEGLAINLALGLGIQKTLDWVSRIAHLSPKGEQIMDFVVTESLAGLQLTLSGSAVGVVIGVGILLANPVIKLIGFLKSRSGERRKANDTPEKVYGTQFARVRSEDENGVVTWYPGILASKDLWTGIGSREQNIRINYGKLEDLHWRYNKNGSFSPYFDHPRYKMINAKDRDLKEYSSEAQRTKYDPLRDFSLFTFDETDNMFSTLVEGKDLSAFQEKADDRSNLGGYMQELISYRDDFEWIRKFNTGGEEIGRHLDPADRSIRREFEHSKLSDPMYVQGRSFVYADMMDDKKYKAGFSTHKKELKENKALLQYFHGRMTDLLRSQKIAAEETPGFLESLKGIGKYNDTYNYTLYALDTGMSPAHSLDELKAQIDKTQARDIPWFQKNYLEQKNIVRYFAKKLSNRALGGDIVHAATYPHQQTYRMDAKNEQTALNYSGILNAAGTFRLQQVGHTSVFGNPPGPWSNSDEGVIPKWLFEDKFIGHLGGGKKDYIAEAQRLHMLMQNQFVSPGLRNTKFKPGKVFVDSNPFLSEGFHTKFKGIVSDKDTGEHRYDRKSERLYDETADEKKARLAAEKKQIGEHGRKKGSLDPFVRVTPAKKVEEKPLTGDPTKRNDKFYADNKDYTWDFDKKRFILKAGGIGQGPRGGKPTLSEHDKQMEHERKSRGFTKSRWEHYLRKHGGKTPDQVEGVGRYSGWHVNIHGGVHPGAKKPDPGVKPDPSSKPVVTKIPRVIPKVIPKVHPPSVHLSALQEYLRDQHGMNVSKEAINSRSVPFLAFDEKGRPALYGDPILHKKLGLPDAYRVVTGPTGYIHKSYDPEKVQPKFFSQHETSVVERY